jgi:formylglycine-generating enzyme
MNIPLLFSLLFLLVQACSIGAIATSPSSDSQAQSPAPNAAIRTNPKDGLKYVWIHPGKFMMGCSPQDTQCDDDEKPPREVAIAKGFWMSQTLITQAAYQRVTGKNPSFFHGDQLPVDGVMWNEAKAYCEVVGMRLPSEAEWEYAARADDAGARYGEVDMIAWYKGNSFGHTHDVAQKQPNPWQLYDMLGNVWEWTGDGYNSEFIALRGGSWETSAANIRVSARASDAPHHRRKFTGFRCVGEDIADSQSGIPN